MWKNPRISTEAVLVNLWTDSPTDTAEDATPPETAHKHPSGLCADLDKEEDVWSSVFWSEERKMGLCDVSTLRGPSPLSNMLVGSTSQETPP